MLNGHYTEFGSAENFWNLIGNPLTAVLDLHVICTSPRSTDSVLDLLHVSLVHYNFSRTKTRTNKIPYLQNTVE